MAYTTIDDPSKYFQTALYASTGNGANITVTNDGNSDLQPDWLWIKVRDGANNHDTFDSSRGITSKRLFPNLNNAEDSNGIESVSSDGFTTGTSIGNINNTSGANNYVAWQWKANGGTTTTNDASSTGVGSIDSVYQANTTAGLSIVTWTGTGSAATIAHGLGATPQVVILKSRDNAHDWFVAHNSMHSTPWEKYLRLHETGAVADDVIWNDTAPTSTVFSVGSYDSTNGNNVKLVAYCFAEKQGYSKFGGYTGNGNANGTFVYTGFKPAWILVKRTDSTNGWFLMDNKRSPFNLTNDYLRPNASDAEGEAANSVWDTLSNGFKLRGSGADVNADGSLFVYMAFAESPFVSSEGVPTTAR